MPRLLRVVCTLLVLVVVAGIGARAEAAGVSVLDPYGAVVARVAFDGGHDELPVASFPTDVRSLHPFQGQEVDAERNLTHMGVRHVSMTGDGRWLQPEPLLHLGPGAGQLQAPRSMFGAYARGTPTNLQDRSGYCPAGMEKARKLIRLGQALSPVGEQAAAVGARSEAVGAAAVLTTNTVAGTTIEELPVLQGAQGPVAQAGAVPWSLGSRVVDGFRSLLSGGKSAVRAAEAARDASKAVGTPHFTSRADAGPTGQPNSIVEQRRPDGGRSVTYYDEQGRPFPREDYGQTRPHNGVSNGPDGKPVPHEHGYTYSDKGPPGKQIRELDDNGRPTTEWKDDW